MNKAIEKAVVRLLEVRALIALMLTVCTIILVLTGKIFPAWLTLYSGAICAYYFTDKYKQNHNKDGENDA